MILKNFKIILILIFLWPYSIFADIYYISPDGFDTNSGSAVEPWRNFKHAWQIMVPGDTLIVKDGIYRQPIKPTISGKPGKVITIKAENDGRAILDGEELRSGIHIYAQHHITIEGFLSINPGENPAIVVSSRDKDSDLNTTSSNIIIRRSGARGGSKDKNHSAFVVARTTNSLLEDVWSFGGGRYAMLIYGSDKITVRRAVARWDRWEGLKDKISDPRFNLGVYNTHNSIFENIILLDAGTANAISDKGALYVPGNDNGKNSPFTDSDNNKFYNIVALNNKDGVAFGIAGGSGGTNDNNYFENIVGLDNQAGISVNKKADSSVFKNVTLKNKKGAWFNPYGTVSNSSIKNSLIFNHKEYGLKGGVNSDYNNVYNNNPDYFNFEGKPGNNDFIPGKDPGLKYMTRLEKNSVGKNSGENGEDRGANVEKVYINGIRTENDLWPWPLEERIKNDMCQADFLNSIGRTASNEPGLCASGKTITKYIWEYLGNTYPPGDNNMTNTGVTVLIITGSRSVGRSRTGGTGSGTNGGSGSTNIGSDITK